MLDLVYIRFQPNGFERHLWKDILDLSLNRGEACYILEDFNNVLGMEDRIGSAPVQTQEFHQLTDMMSSAGIFECHKIGEFFTCQIVRFWTIYTLSLIIYLVIYSGSLSLGKSE